MWKGVFDLALNSGGFSSELVGAPGKIERELDIKLGLVRISHRKNHSNRNSVMPATRRTFFKTLSAGAMDQLRNFFGS